MSWNMKIVCEKVGNMNARSMLWSFNIFNIKQILKEF